MAFFDKLTSAVSGLVKSLTPTGTSPYEVLEVQPQQLTRLLVLCRDGCCTLYKDGNIHVAVIHCPQLSPRAFSLFRVAMQTEATTTFSNFSHKLHPLYASTGRIMSQEMLQRFCDVLRAHPTWTCAHVAAYLGLKECFRQPEVLVNLNMTDETTQESPIQVAIESGNLEVIQELILCSVRLDLADNQGHNVFHCAAKKDVPNIIQCLASKDKSAINQLSIHGESPLHVACMYGKHLNVEQLLRWGADPCLTMSTRYPIHCAVKISSVACIDALCKWNRDQVHLQDQKYKGTPLHWAKNKEVVYALTERGCNLEVSNKLGETPLHIMIKRNRHESVMAVLSKGANAEAIGAEGCNALHLAIKTDNYSMVQLLVVFGCDVNHYNEAGFLPRHVAATHNGSNKDGILYLLHKVGANRCPTGVKGCMQGCAPWGTFNGTSKVPEIHTPEHQKKFYDNMVTDLAMAAAMTRTTSASGSSILCTGETTKTMDPVGDRILCLDGGGIRGLILIKLLMAIEKAAGQPVRNMFDWIGGTSTGGILALAIVHGKSMQYALGLYLRFKDTVFKGQRPYDSEPLEKFMKKEFGENTRMDDKEYPKVLVTSVLGDRTPAELHFFRNYIPPGYDYEARAASGAQFEPLPLPHDQRVWQAARASGAAPTYFRAFGKFLDGGLISNNPTLDVMTEVHEYNIGLKAQNQGERVKPMHVVVSLGTGRNPPKQMDAIDVWKPGGVWELYKVVSGAKNLGELLIKQATLSEGRPVDRAKAMCSLIGIPYFRFSPLLTEDIPLDCTDDDTLINMLWETQAYIYQNWARFEMLATVLKQ